MTTTDHRSDTDLLRAYERDGDEAAFELIAHSTAQLLFLHYGILQARKGWLRKQDVVNTFSLEKITDFLAKPKAQPRPQTPRPKISRKKSG
jgi:histidinol phosphatase-like PHP family hydrolase